MIIPKPSVCIIGGGNAAHTLAALLPHQGYETRMFTPYKDQADQINAGLLEQGGCMYADFAPHNQPSGLIKGKPILVSKNPADVIPNSDVLIAPLPSFTYTSTLTDIKPYLHEGQTLCVTPGQGGFDWIAEDILGSDLLSKITIVGLMPMPFNCRISEYGKMVKVQELKKKYSIGVIPSTAFDESKVLIEDMFGGSVLPAGKGTFLECSLFPINAIIHPSRLITLLSSWEEGKELDENPLFYEDFTPEGAACMDETNKELIEIGKSLTAKGVPVDIPHIFDWLACYVYNEPKESNLQRFFQTNDAYKGFRCPLIPGPSGKGYVPDFENRYFSEDIPCGLCLYKGLADIAQVETPKIDEIIMYCQKYMKKEYVVDGKLVGRDVGETTAPQRFGINTIDELKKLYYP